MMASIFFQFFKVLKKHVKLFDNSECNLDLGQLKNRKFTYPEISKNKVVDRLRLFFSSKMQKSCTVAKLSHSMTLWARNF